MAQPSGQPKQISRGDGQPSGISGQAITRLCAPQSAGDESCPARPVRATIDILRLLDRHRVATVHTDQDGRFRVKLPPGTYELVSRTSGFLTFARPVEARVRPHEFARVEISFVLRHPLPVPPASPG